MKIAKETTCSAGGSKQRFPSNRSATNLRL